MPGIDDDCISLFSIQSMFCLQERMEFLRRDLVHLFDETGIDKDSYEEIVEFVDPITSYRRLSGW